MSIHGPQRSVILTDIKPSRAIHKRGELVFDINDRDSKGYPTRKKLWVWETKYVPNYKDSQWGTKNAILYLVKDGPGENAKDVGWVREEDLHIGIRLEEGESLIDLPMDEEEPLIEL